MTGPRPISARLVGTSRADMARFAPLTPEDLPEFAGIIAAIREDHGYVPNSFLTLGRHPGFLRATGALADALWYDDRLPQPLRRLTGFAFSWFSGVPYSAAHLACGAEDLGLPAAKLQAVDDWETSAFYTDAERAVLRLCRHAARMPGEVTDADVDGLRPHFTEAQILLITGLIAWHAFLNRWNMISATTLEDQPLQAAQRVLAPKGWHPGPHGGLS
jgi:alkylhydroperoxidase family enzyme